MGQSDKRRKTLESYNNSADAYQSKFMHFELYNDTYIKFHRHIDNPNARILDVGCGPGNVTKYLLSLNPAYKITGIDFAPRMVELAKENNPSANFEVMDCREINQLETVFDGILCAFCIPYLSQEETSQLIVDVSESLTPGGVVYLSAMEDAYERSGFEATSFSGQDQVYIYYHQHDFLESCLNQSGFEILSVDRKQYPDKNGGFLTAMIFIAKLSS